jgi:hypothetical protein
VESPFKKTIRSIKTAGDTANCYSCKAFIWVFHTFFDFQIVMYLINAVYVFGCLITMPFIELKSDQCFGLITDQVLDFGSPVFNDEFLDPTSFCTFLF